MTISRRDALMATLFGGSMIGLRSLATGLPAKMILAVEGIGLAVEIDGAIELESARGR